MKKLIILSCFALSGLMLSAQNKAPKADAQTATTSISTTDNASTDKGVKAEIKKDAHCGDKKNCEGKSRHSCCSRKHEEKAEPSKEGK
jgi:hypothetical protein